MAYFSQKKSVEIRPQQEGEVVIKLEITLNVNMSTGQVTVGAVPIEEPQSGPQPKIKNEMKVPEFIIPKFDTTEIIEGFGEDN